MQNSFLMPKKSVDLTNFIFFLTEIYRKVRKGENCMEKIRKVNENLDVSIRNRKISDYCVSFC